jgi:hypothetical protein
VIRVAVAVEAFEGARRLDVLGNIDYETNDRGGCPGSRIAINCRNRSRAVHHARLWSWSRASVCCGALGCAKSWSLAGWERLG